MRLRAIEFAAGEKDVGDEMMIGRHGFRKLAAFHFETTADLRLQDVDGFRRLRHADEQLGQGRKSSLGGK